MVEPVLTTLSLMALRPILSEIAKNTNTFLSMEFEKRFNLKKFSINNKQLIDSIEKIGLVKTLFTGAEKPVEIYSFFYSPCLTTKNGISKIQSLDEIPTKHSILIEATVGQGKSIFMRYLALQESSKNSRIPIFIELKNISKDKSLNFLIKEKIEAWTNNITDEQIKFILQSGNVSLFLDAFDEISKDYITDTLSTVENLANNFSNLKLIVSSRPEHEIKFSNFFETIQVNPYDSEDQKNLIHILVEDPDARITLINSIENSTPEIQQLLTTPLMIGLYVKKFNADFSPPENITSFYRNIFEVVATTHDRTKGGFTRKSSSNLMQDKLEQIFERFCFECYKKDQTAFNRTQIIEYLDLTLQKLNIDKCSSSQVLDDFCNYLCLIAKDGLDYTFIHRSIFEYYVAFFFSKLNKENAEKVIPKISNTNILNFLKHLNIYYFNLFYLKQELEFILDLFKILNKSYQTKQILPESFTSLFFITSEGKDRSEQVLAISQEAYEIIKNHNYLEKEFFSKIFNHLATNYSYPGILIFDTNKVNRATKNLYQKMNNDQKLKELFLNFNKSYDECLIQIQKKNNEITPDDFDDL